MNEKGQFEQLVADIEGQIASAEGSWRMATWYHDQPPVLVITQQESRDPGRSRNGGEYTYWRNYRADGLGVEVWEDWSCDFASRDQYGGGRTYYDCIISADGLERIAKLADVTIAAKAWLAKEPGCMAKLKAAIRSLDGRP